MFLQLVKVVQLTLFTGSESDDEAQEEPVIGKLHWDTFSPPTQIRGRRSANAVSGNTHGKSSHQSDLALDQGDSHDQKHSDLEALKIRAGMILSTVVVSGLLLYVYSFFWCV